MSFGGPIDLTPFGALLLGIGFLHWAIALGAAGIALHIPNRWIVEVPLAGAVLAAFIYPTALRVHEAKQLQAERKARLTQRATGQDPTHLSHGVSVDCEPIERPAGRFGITWDNTTTHEDRERWIAGGAVRVIDLRRAEFIAERISIPALADARRGYERGLPSRLELAA